MSRKNLANKKLIKSYVDESVYNVLYGMSEFHNISISRLTAMAITSPMFFRDLIIEYFKYIEKGERSFS